jgi:hypothetical protein
MAAQWQGGATSTDDGGNAGWAFGGAVGAGATWEADSDGSVNAGGNAGWMFGWMFPAMTLEAPTAHLSIEAHGPSATIMADVSPAALFLETRPPAAGVFARVPRRINKLHPGDIVKIDARSMQLAVVNALVNGKLSDVHHNRAPRRFVGTVLENNLAEKRLIVETSVNGTTHTISMRYDQIATAKWWRTRGGFEEVPLLLI